jgi:hypothetical protein
MRVNYSDYFSALGINDNLYNPETGEYNKEKIFEIIRSIVEKWKEKYPELKFNTEKLKFDNQVTFNQTFTTEVEYLNLETK